MDKDGGQAFPESYETWTSGSSGISARKTMKTRGGMTLRNYFAGQALFLAQKYWENNVDWIAERAYQIADAMIAEGSK